MLSPTRRTRAIVGFDKLGVALHYALGNTGTDPRLRPEPTDTTEDDAEKRPCAGVRRPHWLRWDFGVFVRLCVCMCVC